MRARIWAAIIVSSIGWGTAGIATRAALQEGVGPFTIIGLRMLIAATALFAYLAARRHPLPTRRLWLLGAVIGLTNLTAPYILFTLAVQHASAGFLSLIITNIPLATAVWAHFLLPEESLSPRKAVGLLLAASGVALLLATGTSGLGDAGRAGPSAAMALSGVVIAAFGGVHARRHAPNHDILDLAGPQFALAAAVLIPTMLATEGLPTAVSAAGWGLVVYMAFTGTFMPFLLFFWMLQRVSATTASLPSYLIPVIAVAGGALLLGEEVTWLMAGAGALILAGVVFTERAEPGPPAAGPGPEVAL
ncbi:MAG: DMT family transporter [Actinobacteria bacterium]|nr:DMT family transporter [Actinomycetota bacterium]